MKIEASDDTVFDPPLSFAGDDGPPPILNAGAGFCRSCGKEIPKREGPGRQRVYCEDCKPGASSSSKPTSKSSTGRRNSTDQLVSQLADLYRVLGLGIGFMDGFSGMAIADRSEDMAESWRTVIDRDPKIRKVLERMVTGSGWGTVVTVHAITLLPILSHKGMLPRGVGEMVKNLGDESNPTV